MLHTWPWPSLAAPHTQQPHTLSSCAVSCLRTLQTTLTAHILCFCAGAGEEEEGRRSRSRVDTAVSQLFAGEDCSVMRVACPSDLPRHNC